MPADPNETRSAVPETPRHDLRREAGGASPPDPAFDAGLAAAFAPDSTPCGWLRFTNPSDTPAGSPSPAGEGPAGGRYRLLGEIDKGGMGEVYRAEDAAFGREVAVKVLRVDRAGPAAEARFAAEARVTGRLAHPGIPAVHDLGTLPDGRPFLAMKLVAGRTLADLLAERPDPTADLGRFVRHFLQICQTIAYAHANGVIHRDLKPGNVMIGPFDEVQVMDWGLAKSGGRRQAAGDSEDEARLAATRSGALETQPGSVLGTPAFMPPEQATGDIDQIDERADVFGLGSVLCVILTGKPPYVGGTVDPVQRMAAKGELADAFARLGACGADAELVGICKRCLSADRYARPRDAGEVADAVAGHLTGVEDRARQGELDRAAASAEAREQRKRRRVQAALGLTFTTLVALGGAFAWWRDRQATIRAAEERAVAVERETSREAAFADLRLADDLRRQYRFEAAAAALDQAGQLATRAGADDLIPRVEQAKADLGFVRELDAIRVRRSIWIPDESGGGRFDSQSAPPAYRAVFLARGINVTGVESAAAVVRGSAVRTELVAALDDWTVFEKDEEVRDRVLVVARLADPGPWLDSFRDPAVRRNRMALGLLARSADVRLLTPGTITTLSTVMWRRRLDPSRFLLDAQVAHPGDFLIPFTLGQWSLQWDHPAKMVAYYMTARAIRPDNVPVLANLGHAFLKIGDVAGAISCQREAIRLDPNLSIPHHCLGNALKADGNLVGAIAAYREAIRLDPTHVGVRVDLGMALRVKKDVDGAIAAYREAIRLDPTHAWAHNNLGNALRDKGELGGSLRHLEEAVRLNPKAALTRANLGITHKAKGDTDRAITAYQESIALDPKDARTHLHLGLALRDKGKLHETLACFRRATELAPRDPWGHGNVGWVLHMMNDHAGGAEAYRKAIELEPTSAKFRSEMGVILAAKGDLEEAIAQHEEAVRLDKSKDPVYRPRLEAARKQLKAERTAPLPREVKQ